MSACRRHNSRENEDRISKFGIRFRVIVRCVMPNINKFDYDIRVRAGARGFCPIELWFKI